MFLSFIVFNKKEEPPVGSTSEPPKANKAPGPVQYILVVVAKVMAEVSVVTMNKMVVVATVTKIVKMSLKVVKLASLESLVSLVSVALLLPSRYLLQKPPPPPLLPEIKAHCRISLMIL